LKLKANLRGKFIISEVSDKEASLPQRTPKRCEGREENQSKSVLLKKMSFEAKKKAIECIFLSISSHLFIITHTMFFFSAYLLKT